MDVNTDCMGAMAAEKGKNRDVNRILGGWKRGEEVNIRKVKAHQKGERESGVKMTRESLLLTKWQGMLVMYRR